MNQGAIRAPLALAMWIAVKAGLDERLRRSLDRGIDCRLLGRGNGAERSSSCRHAKRPSGEPRETVFVVMTKNVESAEQEEARIVLWILRTGTPWPDAGSPGAEGLGFSRLCQFHRPDLRSRR